MTELEWDAVYGNEARPPWDIGRPQPAFLRLAERGLLHGRLLDAGCGTGEHTLLAAAHGADAFGVDVSSRAIDEARRKAAERGIEATFEVADALELAALGRSFDTVLDSGLFHVFDDGHRDPYVASLAAVLRSAGRCYLMCFSDRQPGSLGPRRITQAEIREAFGEGWTVEEIVADSFQLNPGSVPGRPHSEAWAHAWLATIRRR